MRKIALSLLVLTFVFVIPAFAIKNNEVGAENKQQVQNQEQLRISITPTGYQIQNKNQIKTQNEEELEQNESNESQNRSENAIDHMSEVAKYVQLLQQTRTVGGIGESVREVAREQNRAQNEIQTELNKLESKSKFAKFISGSNYGALNNLAKQLEENKLRIESLGELKNQLKNQADITMVEETIQALTQENILIEEKITSETQTRSMFGWLFKLFAEKN
jgi:hypothetical protein